MGEAMTNHNMEKLTLNIYGLLNNERPMMEQVGEIFTVLREVNAILATKHIEIVGVFERDDPKTV